MSNATPAQGSRPPLPADEAERRAASLEAILGTVAHDLREPLFAAGGFLEVLEERHGGELSEEGRACLAASTRSLARARALLEALLAYASSGAPPAAAGPVEIPAVLTDVLENLHPTLQATGAQVTQAITHHRALADPQAVAQILQNLIGNALKHRREETPRIRIVVTLSGSMVRVDVEDNGVGIPPEDIPRLFQPFARGRHATPEGTGLGLAICRRAVERQGGTIWVTSTPGEGSTFSFTLPPSP